jgi:hypothetical protein
MNFNVNNERIMKKIEENNDEISIFQKNKRFFFSWSMISRITLDGPLFDVFYKELIEACTI